MEIRSDLIEAHIIRRQERGIEFLLMKRSPNEKYGNVWQMVTGSIEASEKAFEAAVREIKEETSLIPSNFWIVPNLNSFYSLEDSINLVPVFVAEVGKDPKVVKAFLMAFKRGEMEVPSVMI